MKKEKNTEKKESSFISSFINNYKNNKGFESLVKLTLYFIFIIGLIVSMSILNNKDYSDEEIINEPSETTEAIITKSKLTVKDVLENINKPNTNFTISIEGNNLNYLISASSKPGIITGTIESSKDAKLFKIKNNEVYEVKMKKEYKNDTLFKDINLNYIIPSNLLNILLNNKIIKHKNENQTILNYNINKDIIEVLIEKQSVKSITINSNGVKYLIEYN